MLDEMFSPRIAALLRRRGIDCVCGAEDELLRAQDDATVLAAALDQGRLLVTNNVIDFETLRRRLAAVNQPVPGLIYTDDATIPRNREYLGRIAAALAEAAEAHLTEGYGGVLWLTSPAAEQG
jgi:predicted nuclease of predicted toxin-antitoxin system